MSTRLARRRVVKTASYTIIAPSESAGTVYTNRGATGSVTFTLPTPGLNLLGWWYEFRAHADQSLIVASPSAGQICAPGNAAADNVGFQTASAKVGRGLLAVCDGTQWLCARSASATASTSMARTSRS
jgi:hypothetical protein